MSPHYVVWAVLLSRQIVNGQMTAGGYIMDGYGNNMFGTQTAYFWKHWVRAPKQINSLMKIQFEGQTCSAIHVNVVARHGARYTSVDEMRAFTTFQNKLKTALGNQSYSFINTWKNKYPEAMAEMLTSLGKHEMNHLGEIHGVQLYDLLNKAANGSTFKDEFIKFSATRKVRTQESAVVFRRELSRIILGVNKTSPVVQVRDDILRFYDNCKKYEEAIATNPELQKFHNGPEMQMVLDDVTRKLNLNITLTVGSYQFADDVKLLWLLCATEMAVMNYGRWCSLMTNTHREIMEYENDLKDYYTRLYGHPVTAQMACPLTRDIFTEMDSAITAHDKGINHTVGIFQFGHADTVIDLAANLGLFDDKIQFRADNYRQLQNRTFNSASVDHFSTHFTFILYNCGGSGSHNYALKLLFNGEPLNLPSCNSDVCRYDTVRKGYSPSVDQCDWSRVCDVTQPGVPVGK